MISTISTVGQVCLGLGRTNRCKVPDIGPEAVVGQLAPPTGVADGAVVEDTAEDVNEDGDEEDDAENAARADAARLVWLSVRAGMDGSCFEEVCAFVGVGADE